MAQSMINNQMDGQSITRPPYFDGNNYSYWKTRITFFLMQDSKIWRCVKDGIKLPDLSAESWSAEEEKAIELNAKAVNILFCALSPTEYNRVCTCTTAKEIWDKLEVTHEGTKLVKDTKANLLLHDYEMFIMNTTESIKEMYTRFNDVVTGLEALGKKFSEGEKVRKLLRSLPKNWEVIRTAIQQARDLDKLSVDELLGSLMTEELMMKRTELNETKGKSGLALKAIASDEEEDDDNEIVFLTRKFKRFVKQRKFNKKFSKKDKEASSSKDQIRCYECKKPGHIRSDCPFLKKEKKYKKKILAAWSDEDSTTESEPSDDEIANLCLMARENEEDEVSDFSNPDNDFSFEELQEAFDELMHDYKKACSKIFSMKKELSNLKDEVKNLNKQNDILKNEVENFQNKNKDLNETLLKFTNGKEKLDMILGNQRFVNNKSGIGNNFSNKDTKTYFIKSSMSNSKIKCHYCGRIGHHVGRCMIRNGILKVKQIWVPKGTFVTNHNGPNKVWVPKNQII